MTTNNITTKRFVIRKTLIGKNTIITFTTNKGDKVSYNHDKVYDNHIKHLETLDCWGKYKRYTKYCYQSSWN